MKLGESQKFSMVASLPFWIILFLCMVALMSTKKTEYSNDDYCNAIYFAEGEGFYGIPRKRCQTQDDCRRMCINTVAHARKLFPKNFEESLARKYCPYNSRIWLKNVRFFLRRGQRLPPTNYRRTASLQPGELDG